MTFKDLFALYPTDQGGWAARCPPASDEIRLFGGLLLGLATAAVCREAKDRCHSLHAMFTQAAGHGARMRLAVATIRDGSRFAARRVEVFDGERLLLTGFSSHHGGDDGPAHQLAMPDVPPPEALEDRGEVAKLRQATGQPSRLYLTDQMLDIRVVEMAPDTSRGLEGRRAFWFRPREPVGCEPGLHQAVIAFASDMGLVHVGVQVHYAIGAADRLQTTSLDHAIWFHADVDPDSWLLHVQRCPVTGEGRGLSYGVIYTRDGRLVASVAQEFLTRRKGTAPA